MRVTTTSEQEGHMEDVTTQMEDEHIALPVYLLVQTICNGSCCWLIDDTQHIQTCYFAYIYCGLALADTEVCRRYDYRICRCLASLSLTAMQKQFPLSALLYFDFWFSFRIYYLEWSVPHVELVLIVEMMPDQTICLNTVLVGFMSCPDC